MKKICILTILFLSLTSMLSAAFKDSGWGVRPLGMAGAFTAIADDSNAPLFNPAGLAVMEENEISLMSAKLFTGLEGVDISLNYLTYINVFDESVGNFGITWAAMSSLNLYREDTVNISYGRSIYSDEYDLMVGANLKYLSHTYTLDVRTADDPVFANGTIRGVATADIGFLFMLPYPAVSFAVVGKNLSSPDIGLETLDKVPSEYVFGVSYFNERMPYITFPMCTFALDLVSRDKTMDYRFGFETWISDERLAIRSGICSQSFNIGVGYEFEVMFDKALSVDYAFAFPLEIEETTGSHRIGLTFRFP
ncbi:type IX secretion system membrane protein PorP/SprF [Elusimicrobiota bacterium]